MAIYDLTRIQTNGIEDTAKKITDFLNYCSTHLELTRWYTRSDMNIYIYIVMHPTYHNHKKKLEWTNFYIWEKLKNTENLQLRLRNQMELYKWRE